jgi:hemolysin activation/secretion protein
LSWCILRCGQRAGKQHFRSECRTLSSRYSTLILKFNPFIYNGKLALDASLRKKRIKKHTNLLALTFLDTAKLVELLLVLGASSFVHAQERPVQAVAAGQPALGQATSPQTTPAATEVEVRPFVGAIAANHEPRESPAPSVERAPVRPLQDRQPVPAPAPALIAQTSTPNDKPAPVIVQPPSPAATAAPVTAADNVAAPGALKFDIDRYVVEGNTLLESVHIYKALATYAGKDKDFADVQRALEALQTAYQKAGWGVAQVTLPEQELERGEVRFVVTETKIGKVEVQGNEFFTEANVRRSLPALREGKTPNSLAIARSLKVANESSVKQSQVSLKAGASDGEIDATIKVIDENPRKYSVGLDNTGTDATGRFRLGFGFQNSNLWDRDHQLTLQYITNPDHVNKVTVLGAGYHVPLYGRGDSIDVVLGYSDVDSGVVQQLFSVSGAGLIVLGRYNMNLKRIEDYEHKIIFGLDYKAFQSRVLTTSGVALVPDITLRPASLGYAGELRDDKNSLNFYTTLSYNAFAGGNDAAQSDFKASRGSAGGASAEYVIWRAGVNYQRLLPADFSFRFSANAQSTRNALVAGEQFGVGGASSVRGFNERIYSNDKGHQATLELITPDLGPKLGFEGGHLRFLAFYDTANLSRNFIQPGEQTGLGIDSVGFGARLNFRDRLSLRLDYAHVLHDGGQDSGLLNGRRNSNTVHASVLFVY